MRLLTECYQRVKLLQWGLFESGLMSWRKAAIARETDRTGEKGATGEMGEMGEMPVRDMRDSRERRDEREFGRFRRISELRTLGVEFRVAPFPLVSPVARFRGLCSTTPSLFPCSDRAGAPQWHSWSLRSHARSCGLRTGCS